MITEGFTEKLTTSDDSYEAGEHLTPFPSEAALLQNGQPQLLAQAETQQGATQQGAEAVATTTATQPGEQTVVAENNIVKLPAGTSIENIELDGNNIVLTQPDGSRVVIENAALHVPTFVIDDVEIPQEALVAALEANNINVAAGPDGTLTATAGGNTSGGGNFSEAIPGIGDAGPAIDLLPPTALQFGTLDQELLFPALDKENEAPSIGFPNTIGGSDIAIGSALVDEAGLANGTDPDGAQDPTLRATTTGTFRISDPDGLDDIASLTINGQTISIGGLVGSSIAGTLGTLTITAYDTTTGVVSYGYTLTSPFTSAGPNSPSTEQDKDIFSLTVTDQDGLSASATLNIDVVDDGPNAPGLTATDANTIVLKTFDGGLSGNFTGPELAGDTNVSKTVATMAFAGAFAATTDAGADGGSTVVTYALQLASTYVAGTAINLTSGAQALYLHTIAGGMIAATTSATPGAGTTVFTLAVDAAGNVTLTQLQPIDHASDVAYSGAYIDDVQSLASGLVEIKATALTTDGDGDTASSSATLDLGGNVSFGDDGPNAPGLTATDANTIVLKTFDGGLSGNFTGPELAGDTNVSKTVATMAFAGAFAATTDAGADGGSTVVTYALQLASTYVAGTAINLTSGAQALYLHTIAGGMIAATTSATPGAGTTVFTLAVDAAGNVTLTQLQPIDHASDVAYSGAYIDDVQSLASGLVEIKATALTTDGDGDTASSSATLDLGGNVSFGDDGPNAPGLTATDANTIVLKTFDGGLSGNFTGPELAGDTNVSKTVATMAFAGAFAATTDAGADGGSTVVTYALQLASTYVAGTAINLTSGAQALYLHTIAGGMIAATTSATPGAGTTVFTLAVDAAGNVTLTQLQPIDHASDVAYSGAYIDDVQSLASGLVEIKATALTTDGDGDTASSSATLDLGGNVSFGDDGPNAPGLTATDANTIVLKTFDGGLSGNFTGPELAGDTNVSKTVATMAFAGAFAATTDAGADGGSTVVTYALQLASTYVAGTAINLTSGAQALYLHTIAGGMIAATTSATPGAGTTVFTLAVDAAGNVTLTQLQPIDHASDVAYSGAYIDDVQSLASGLVEIKATALTTDGDGDTASSSATLDLGGNVSFGDDGPNAPGLTATDANTIVLKTFDGGLSGNFTGPELAGDTNVSKTVATMAFAGAFAATTDAGADGGSTVVTYALQLASTYVAGTAINLTSGAQALYLHTIAGGMIAATTSATPGAGTTVFTLAVDAAGNVTLTQLQPIDHASDVAYSGAYIDDVQSLASGLVEIKATALTTDGDGDTASSSATLDLGGNVSFGDDGPNAPGLTATDANTIVLKTFDGGLSGNFTGPELAGDTNVSKTVATMAFAGAFAATTDAGADGGSTVVTYALQLASTYVAGTAINLTSGAQALYLHTIAGGMIAATTSATPGAGTTVFTLAVDAAGNVTLTQLQPIDHASDVAYSGAYIDDVQSLASGLVEIKATALTTDGDGDTASSSATLDLGGNVSFGDDGPNAPGLTATDANTIVLKTFDGGLSGNFTGPELAGDTNVSKTVATMAFAGAFAATTDAGADGGSTVVTYALQLASTYVAGTAINLTSGAQALYLHTIAGGMIAATTSATPGAGTTVFTLAVDAAGNVTLTQLQPIDHASDVAYSGAYIDDVQSLASGLVEIKATALTTDGDGDTASSSATLDLGGNVSFGDDGPNAPGLTATDANTIVLKTFDGGLSGNFTGPELAGDTNVSKTVATMAFAGAFAATTDAGADGGSTVVTYALQLASTYVAGTAINLTSGAQALYLHTIAGGMIAATTSATPGAGTTVFTLAVDAAGNVTLTQLQPIDHASDVAYSGAYIDDVQSLASGLVEIKATALTTDGDGDTASSSATLDLGGNVSFGDDGPNAPGLTATDANTIVLKTFDGGLSGNFTGPELAGDTNVSKTVATMAFAGAFAATTDAGADGGSTVVTYALQLASTYVAGTAINLTSGAQALYLHTIAGGMIAATTSATPGAGTTVFTLAVDAAGNVTLTQLQPIDHASDVAYSGAYIDDVQSLASGLVEIKATALTTDGDGDTASSSATLDLGGNVSFGDDGPNAPGLTATDANTIVLKTFDGGLSGNFTGPELAGDTNVSKTVATMAFAGAFAATTDAGADGGSTVVTYALQLASTYVAGTAINLTSGAQALYLHTIAGGMIAATTSATPGAGTTVFTLAVDAAGNVTLTQLQPIDHASDVAYSGAYIDDVQSLASGLVEIKATALTTDGDGDTASSSATLDLGGNVSFGDDGPNAPGLTATDANTIVLKTFDGGLSGNFTGPELAGDTNVSKTVATMAFAGAFAATTDAGADGGSTVVTYALQLASTYVAGTAINLTSGAQALYLHTIAGGMIAATTSATPGAGTTVFTLAVDAAGNVTLTQLQPIDHASDVAYSGAYIDDVQSLASGLVEIKATALTTDGDGDTASSSATLDLGGNVSFGDDGPNAPGLTATDANTIVLKTFDGGLSGNFTGPELAGDTNVSKTVATMAFAGAFAATTDAGADGGSTVVTYALQLASTYVAGTAINLTSGAQALYLHTIAGGMIAATTSATPGAGTTVFTLAVDAAGNVTLTQLQPIDHASDVAYSGAYIDDVQSLASGLVEIKATALTTDGDGDTASSSATLDLGGNVSFGDDGPNAPGLTATDANTIVLKTFDGGLSGNFTGPELAGDTNVSKTVATMAFAGAFAATTDAGADGGSTVVTYALQLASTYVAGTAINLTSGAQALYLHTIAGGMIAATTSATPGAGTTVFTLAVDAAGNVTLTQLQPIDHASDVAYSGAYIDDVQSLASGLVEIKATALTTDGDGDTASSSATLDLGGNVSFGDDGPNAPGLTATDANTIVLKTFDGGLSGNFTGPELAGDTNVSKTVATMAFAGAFAATTDAGADGGSTVVTYALQLASTYVAGTAINLTSGAQALYLHTIAGGMIAATTSATPGAGTTVFTLAVDAAGNVTLTQLQPIDHASDVAYSGAYIDDVQSLASGLVEIKATALTTDGDGDTASSSATLDLGGNVSFGDDGPNAPGLTATDANTIVLKTFDGGLSGNFTGPELAGDTNVSKTVATMAFAGAFAATTDAGADGGSTVVTYALQLASTYVAGTAINLTSGAQALYLHTIAGGMIAATTSATPGAGTTVFTLAVDAAGNVTLTQLQPIDHASDVAYSGAYIDDVQSLASGLVEIKATALTTDGDGDTASSSATLDLGGNVSFGDDGPNAPGLTATDANTIVLKTFDGGLSGNFTGPELAGDTNVSKTVATMAFAGAFAATTDAGADGGSTVVTYALQLASTYVAGTAINLTSGAQALYLHTIAGGMIAATTSATPGAGTTVFTLAVDAAGNVTLTQLQPIDHASDVAYSGAYIDDVQSLASGLVEIKATALTTDGDGDTASSSATLDLGGNVSFGDDGPNAPGLTATDANTIVLKTFDGGLSGNFTGPELAGDTNVSKTVATMAFAGAFAATTDAGADGGSTVVTYALQLASTYVAGTAINLTSGAQALYLHTIAGGMIAATTSATPGAGTTVFTLAVDAAGNVTLTQLQPIDHASDVAYSGAYIDDVQSLASGLVEIKATALTTDGDGDTASSSATLDLGGNVSFGDDGPNAPGLTATDANTIVLKTFDGGLSGNFTGPELAGDTNVSKTVATMAFAGAFAATTDAGADGGSTVVTYALQLASTYVAGTAINLTSGAQALYLHTIAGGMIAATTSATPGAGTTVFTLAVDAAGNVTLTQLQPIDHASDVAYSGAYIDDVQSLASGLVEIKATALTTDGDGDTASSSATLDLGGNVSFGDDGPNAPGLTATDANTIVLKTFDGGLSGNFTGPELAGDTNVSKTVATMAFAGAFAATTDAGADGGSTVVTYALQLASTYVAGTAINLTSGAQALYLHTIAGGMIAATTSATPGAGTTVFTLAVDAAGNVTLTQLQPIDHASDVAYSGAYIDDVQSLASGLVEIKATALTTDGDGDTASSSATLDLGGNVSFGDDGPNAPGLTATDANTIVLKTFDGGLSGNFTGPELAGDTNVSKTVATMAFAGAFAATTDAGADGGSTVVTYALQLASTYVAGTAINLTSGAQALYLHTIAGGMIAATTSATPGAGTTVFTLAVDAAGNVTLTQLQPIDHASDVAYSGAYIDDVQSLASGLVEIKATALTTDGDGDTASSSATLDLGGNVSFGDDGPNGGAVTATPQTFVLDESRPLGTDTASGALPGGRASISASLSGSFAAANFGADGAATLNSVVYSLIVAAGTQSGLFALDPSDKVLDADGIGQGNAILLYVSADGKTITGSTAAAVGNINAGNTYFRITATDLGLVTFTQLKNIWHPTPGTGSYDEAASITASISLTRTLTDGDGDKASSTLTLGSGTFTIQDSGPSYTGATDGVIGNIAGQVEGTITGSFGSDGPGSIVINALNALSGVTVSAPQATPDGGMQIVATTTVNSVATTFYTMTWYQDGHYVFDLVTPRPTTTVSDILQFAAPGNYDVVSVNTGGNNFLFDGVLFNNEASNTFNFTADDGNKDNLNVSTETFGAVSATGFGIGAANQVSNNEGFVFYSPQSDALSFSVNLTNQASGVTFSWATYSTDPRIGAPAIQQSATGLVVAPNGTVTIDPTLAFDWIVVRLDSTKGGAKLGNFQSTKAVVPGDTSLNFGVTYTDADGDQVVGSTTVDSQVINILLAGNTTTTFTGDAGSDWFTGTSAAETFIGNGGVDTVDYSGSNAAVIVNLGDALTETGGHAAGDTLTNISNILGSNQADTITGSSGNNLIEGGAGADTLNGGTGIDTVSYAHSSVGVTVDLGIVGPTAQTSPGDASGDKLTGFENILGSAFNDTLTGDINDNLLMGGAGDDQLHGGGGSDRLVGGDGFDRLWGDGGNDVFVLDGSNLTVADTIEDYVLGDEVDLTALLDGVAAANIGNYVKVEEVGAGPVDVLKVNTAGTGLAADFVTVAHLDANTGVKILYNDETHTNQHATVTI